MTPTLETLLEAAASGEVRDDVTTRELLSAVAKLCMPVAGEGLESSRRMVAPLVDGLHLSRLLATTRGLLPVGERPVAREPVGDADDSGRKSAASSRR